ncbi:DMT family transporter [Brachybacterium sp. FME24]|uniref:DMT family transporter n=1 Tax=Brachybacterium sp. FME24 TaxID=2742605 RepID=UPI0027154386|nr:DMT family transporter [Brachybacterium sp. FME24]
MTRTPPNAPPAPSAGTTSVRPRPSAPLWAVPAAVVCGVMGAIQSRINSDLAAELDDGFAASSISFGSGLVVILLLLVVMPRVRRLCREFWRELRSGSFPWYLAIGGLGGAMYVLGQTFSVSLLGVALFIVCVVAGQTVTGLVVDRVGLGPGGVRHLTPLRVLGAGLMVVSVALAMSGGISTEAPWYLLALPMVAGVAMGLQQAINGRVTQHSGHFLVATLGNFVVGTTALLLVALVHMLVAGAPESLPTNPLLYLGGPIGVVFIAMAAYLAGPLGILTLAMSTIAGQIVGSVVLDAVAAPGHLTYTTIAGAGLTLVAAVLAASSRRRAS